MKTPLAGLLIALALPSRAALVVGMPRIETAPVMAGALPSLAAPALAAPALFGAASLSAPSLSAAPAFAPALTAPIAAALAPSASPAAPSAALAALPASISAAAAALSPAPSAAPQSGSDRRSDERRALDAARLFDGAAAASVSDAAPVPEAAGAAAPAAPDAGWTQGSFKSADGLDIAYKRRAGPPGATPRVYSGGLALNESFDALFARSAPPARSEYFSWTRGHRPTGWTPTTSVLDADARDLARLIVLAAKETGAPKVELAVHSFGAVVFQRMTQLRGEPEVRRALKLLSGSRVVMMNGMTHYGDVEKLGGPAVEQMAQATRMIVAWLDSWDALAAQWKSLGESNPFFALQAQAWLAAYDFSRAELLSAAAKGAVDAMRKDLEAPWDPSVDPIRRGFQKALEKNAYDLAWQEALLRRSYGSFALDFKTSDAEFLRRLGVRLELVHSLGDQLLNWQAAQLLFGRFGIKTHAAPPPAGTVLTDPSGTFKATVVDADHYYPLKKSADLARRLDP